MDIPQVGFQAGIVTATVAGLCGVLIHRAMQRSRKDALEAGCQGGGRVFSCLWGGLLSPPNRQEEFHVIHDCDSAQSIASRYGDGGVIIPLRRIT